MHLQQSQCMHSSFPSTSVDSSYIRRTVSCGAWSFEDEGVVNTRVYPQIPSSVARASGVASFKNCLMFDRNGPKYSTFRLIQGVGSAVFTVLFLSSMPSVLGPAELVLLPKVRLEAAMSLSLSYVMLCGSTKIKTQPRVNPSSADLSLRRLLRRPRPRALGSKFACFSPFFGLFDGCNHPQKGQKTQLRKEEGKRNPNSLSLSLSLRETAAPTRSTRSNARVDAIGVGSLFLPLSPSLSLSRSVYSSLFE